MNKEKLNPITKKYLIRVIGAMFGYTVATMAVGFAAPLEGMGKLLAFFPIIAILLTCYFYVKAIQALDEMQRAVMVNAMAIAGLVTAVLCMTYTFLEQIGLPPFQAYYAFLSIMIWWGGLVMYQKWDMNRDE